MRIEGVVPAQPCRCLWRGFSQMTMTRLWRRITLHLSQMGLTLGLTFTAVTSFGGRGSLVAVNDAPASQVVR